MDNLTIIEKYLAKKNRNQKRVNYYSPYTIEQFNEDLNLYSVDVEMNSQEYYNLYSEWATDNYDSFIKNLSYSKYNDNKFIIIGTLGLWNGRVSIIPKCCSSLIDVIKLCANNCDDIEVYQINGHIEIDAMHHDGTNHFTIYMLNKKGLNTTDRADLTKKCYHKNIKDFLF